MNDKPYLTGTQKIVQKKLSEIYKLDIIEI